MLILNLISVGLAVVSIPAVFSFRLSLKSMKSNSLHRVSSLKMGIDVSGLPKFLPDPKDVMAQAASSSTGSWTDVSNALILLGGLAYFAYEKRPRGSARDDLMEVKQSTIPNANLGVFSKKFISKGTKIGRYPGFLKSTVDGLASKEDEKARTSAQSYWFAVNDEQVIDPTNKSGLLDNEISFLGGLITVNVMVARINEPPLGKDVNVCTEISGSGVTIFAERDIFPNEELFIDYGELYDRSSYANTDPENMESETIELKRRQLEKEEMMSVQPIMGSSEKQGQDQGATLADGFLGKLTKQDENKYQKVGILSPEEGADMFARMGNGAFGEAEGDRSNDEITKNVKREVRSNISKNDTDSFGSNSKAQNVADFSNTPDILSKTSIPATVKPSSPVKKSETISASSIFDALIGDGLDVPPEDMGESRSQGILGGGGVGFGDKEKKGEISDAALKGDYRPAMSVKESEQLLNSLDDMSDAEVNAIMRKLQAAVGDRMKDEISEAMFNKNNMAAVNLNKKQINENIQKELKKMPRAPAVDPEMRKKYGKELEAIENELEKIYSDPLGVWQELMANPEKFLKENEIPLADDEQLQ